MCFHRRSRESFMSRSQTKLYKSNHGFLIMLYFASFRAMPRRLYRFTFRVVTLTVESIARNVWFCILYRTLYPTLALFVVENYSRNNLGTNKKLRIQKLQKYTRELIGFLGGGVESRDENCKLVSISNIKSCRISRACVNVQRREIFFPIILRMVGKAGWPDFWASFIAFICCHIGLKVVCSRIGVGGELVFWWSASW